MPKASGKILKALGFRKFRGKWLPKPVLRQMWYKLIASNAPGAHEMQLELAVLLNSKADDKNNGA